MHEAFAGTCTPRKNEGWCLIENNVLGESQRNLTVTSRAHRSMRSRPISRRRTRPRRRLPRRLPTRDTPAFPVIPAEPRYAVVVAPLFRCLSHHLIKWTELPTSEMTGRHVGEEEVTVIHLVLLCQTGALGVLTMRANGFWIASHFEQWPRHPPKFPQTPSGSCRRRPGGKGKGDRYGRPQPPTPSRLRCLN